MPQRYGPPGSRRPTDQEEDGRSSWWTDGRRPPWAGRMQGARWRGDMGPWTWQRRRRLFWRFALIFGLIMLLIAGSMGVMALLLTQLAGGGRPVALLTWLGGLFMLLVLPVLAVRIGRHAARRITTPLSNVMQAAEAVAAGDLTTRVPAGESGEFGRLVESFNNMVAELQRSDAQRRNLTADVAHELRTPLHIIQGNLEGVLDGVYPASPEHIQATLDETRALARSGGRLADAIAGGGGPTGPVARASGYP